MKASRVMTRSVHCITPQVSLERAWRLMQRHHVRHLPVMWGDKVAGVLSDRDLLVHAEPGLGGALSFPHLTAADAMTRKPVTALESATLSSLARLMLEAQFDCVPIVNRKDDLVGLVTSADLLELLAEPEQESAVLPFSFAVRGPAETLAETPG